MKTMSVEKPRSIMCETCGGWHTTEAHAQHEKEAREVRMAKIKARPDEAYNFDALGFTPEQKGEIEPWMHTVIEKAKNLGDDLQDSDFFAHIGVLGQPSSSESLENSTLNLIIAESLQEAQTLNPELYVSEHKAGEKVKTWAEVPSSGLFDQKGYRDLLVLQEKWVESRNQEDLVAYRRSITDTLNLITSEYEKPHYTHENDQKILDDAKYHLANLDSTQGRRGAVKFIMRLFGWRGPEQTVGVLFHINQNLSESFNISRSKTDTNRVEITDADGGEIMYIEDEGWQGTTLNQRIDWDTFSAPRTPTGEFKNVSERRRFYKDFLHGIYVPGDVEDQRKIIAHILEITKEHPEKRLPMYNFYGKLIWPKPPEEDK